MISQTKRILCCLLLAVCTVAAQKSCFTPNGAYGQCVSYKQCTYVVQVLEKYGAEVPPVFRKYLLESRCNDGANEIHICCDVKSVAAEATAAPTTTTTRAPIANALFANDLSTYEASLDANGVAVLSDHQCGRSNADRIAFGEEANLFDFPWMTLLRYNTPDQPFKCGGSLITNRYVLTAAHCVSHIGFKLIGVRLGEHNIDTEIDCQLKGNREVCAPPVEDFGIERIIPHPEYSRTRMINDVALLKLDSVVEFKRHIKPICLPIARNSAEVPIDKKYFIAGWGTTEAGSTSRVLQKAIIPHKSREECQTIFKRTRITETQICAGGEGRVDACKGDSGGPLFFVAPYKRSANFVQYGIVSFGGVKCGANETYPGIYSNVVQLMPWITRNID